VEADPEEALPSKSTRTHRWRLVLLIAVTGFGAAVTGILGVSRLDPLPLALFIFIAGAVLAAITYAITEEKHRILALWISTGLCASLLIGLGIYEFIGPTSAQTANMVANETVDLSAEAGVSPTKEPASDYNGEPIEFGPGDVDTATCYAIARSSIWLYFHFGSEDAGWAPFSDFHYQNGFPQQLPSRC